MLIAVAIPLAVLDLILMVHQTTPEPAYILMAEPAATASQNPPTAQEAGFQPVELISASDVQYPMQTTAEGVVVFNVTLDEQGHITGMDRLTGVSPLTDAAQSSLRAWKFKPADWNGEGRASQMLGAFVFR
ncbi:MAG: energy transducer TonB, partial [Candidatus Acidiferrales bacterium]